MTEKNSFIFYETFYEQLECLDESQQIVFYKAIVEYGLFGKEKDFAGIEKAIWISIKFGIDTAKNKRNTDIENGKKGGRPKKENPPLQKENPPFNKNNPAFNVENLNGNVNDNINDNVTVNDNNNVNEKENAKKAILDLFQDLFINTFNQKPKFDGAEIRHIYSKISQYDLSDLEYVILESFSKEFYQNIDTCTPSKMLSKKNIESCLSRKQQDEEIKALYPPEQIICQECGNNVGEDKICHTCKIKVSAYGLFMGYLDE